MRNYSASLTWKRGLWIGFIAAMLDIPFMCVINTDISFWLLIQTIIAWTLVGWVAIATESGLRPTLHGMFVTSLLSIPWFIQYAFLAGDLGNLIPLMGMSLMFGAIFGRAKRYWCMHG
jgi:hypothetical protein